MARYNLPLNDIYTILDSFNTGGIENACTCDNCGKPIVNVAVIENIKKEVFNVGLDCASTLNNLKDFYFLELEFKELKAIQAKMNKAKKQGFELIFEISKNGNLVCFYNYTEPRLGFNREIQVFWKDIDFAKKYLKSYLKLVTNPDKIGFKYNIIENIEPIEYFKKSENLDFVKLYNINGFDFKVTIKPYLKDNGEISGHDLFLESFKDTALLRSNRVTIGNRIAEDINISMRNYYFENYQATNKI